MDLILGILRLIHDSLFEVPVISTIFIYLVFASLAFFIKAIFL
jgi:hypothetical protein